MPTDLSEADYLVRWSQLDFTEQTIMPYTYLEGHQPT